MAVVESSSPPGEEGPSALEALRVGLAVGALRRPRRLHDHRRHLHQLQRRLGVLQGLAQVQDLEVKRSNSDHLIAIHL